MTRYFNRELRNGLDFTDIWWFVCETSIMISLCSLFQWKATNERAIGRNIYFARRFLSSKSFTRLRVYDKTSPSMRIFLFRNINKVKQMQFFQSNSFIWRKVDNIACIKRILTWDEILSTMSLIQKNRNHRRIHFQSAQYDTFQSHLGKEETSKICKVPGQKIWRRSNSTNNRGKRQYFTKVETMSRKLCSPSVVKMPPRRTIGHEGGISMGACKSPATSGRVCMSRWCQKQEREAELSNFFRR